MPRLPRSGTIAVVSMVTIIVVAGIWIQRRFSAKDRVIAEQKRVIEQLQVTLDRVWATELVADVVVDRVGVNERTGVPEIGMTFVQYEPGTDKPMFKRAMTLPGTEFYIDALVLKFERSFVERGDGLRGKSMLLFRRAFGDRQNPADGVPLYRRDSELPVPSVFQVDDEPGEFEIGMWQTFWRLANDPELAKSEGVAVAQGEAPHINPVQGQVYKITLRKSGGLDITPRLPAAVVGD